VNEAGLPKQLPDDTVGNPDSRSVFSESNASSIDFKIQVERYEGPLDLLLDLIRKHKLDIFDIPIAQITSQYLDYIRRADELSVELGGEFVFMAATLIQIKSRMLLPKNPIVTEDEQEDPREELIQRLIEYDTFKQASQMLLQKRVVEENTWSNPPLESFLDENDDPGLTVSVFDLVQTFQEVLERAKNRPRFDVPEDDVSVENRIFYLKNMLLSEGRTIGLRDVFERQPNRRSLIATFLAVLEMVRMQAIILRQDKLFGDIVIRKHKMFDIVFDGDRFDAALEGEPA
jgi:segregation and condensation protein A